MPNTSKEDYLRVIYKNLEVSDLVNPTMIAEQLSISNAAVTDMLKRLKKEKYIDYTPYKGIQLLKKGKIEATKLVRNHRIWESFLFRVVGLPWYQLDEEAENLEHSSSDYLIDRLEEILNFPDFDPHGHPIPKKNGKIPKQKKFLPVSSLKTGCYGIIKKVSDHNKDLLVYLYKSGLVIDTKIKVLEKRRFDDSIVVFANDKELVLSDKISKNIFVEEIK